MKYIFHGALSETEKGFRLRVYGTSKVFDGNEIYSLIGKARLHLLKALYFGCEDNKKKLPSEKEINNCRLELNENETSTFIDCDIDSFIRECTGRSVKKNCTLPAWIARAAEDANINISAVLQEALIEKLHLNEELYARTHNCYTLDDCYYDFIKSNMFKNISSD